MIVRVVSSIIPVFMLVNVHLNVIILVVNVHLYKNVIVRDIIVYILGKK